MVALQRESFIGLPELRDQTRIHADVVPFSSGTLARMKALNAEKFPLLERMGIAPVLLAARIDQQPTLPGTGTIRVTTAEPPAPTLGDLARQGDPRIYSADFVGNLAHLQGKLHKAGVLYAGFQPDSILAVPGETYEPHLMIRRLAFVHSREGALDNPAIYAQQLSEAIAAVQLRDAYPGFIAEAYRPRKKHTNPDWQKEDDTLFVDELQTRYADAVRKQQRHLGLPEQDSPLTHNIVTGLAFPERLVHLRAIASNQHALLAA